MVLSYLLRGFRKYDDLAYEFFWDLDKEKVGKFLGFFLLWENCVSQGSRLYPCFAI